MDGNASCHILLIYTSNNFIHTNSTDWPFMPLKDTADQPASLLPIPIYLFLQDIISSPQKSLVQLPGGRTSLISIHLLWMAPFRDFLYIQYYIWSILNCWYKQDNCADNCVQTKYWKGQSEVLSTLRTEKWKRHPKLWRSVNRFNGLRLAKETNLIF